MFTNKDMNVLSKVIPMLSAEFSKSEYLNALDAHLPSYAYRSPSIEKLVNHNIVILVRVDEVEKMVEVEHREYADGFLLNMRDYWGLPYRLREQYSKEHGHCHARYIPQPMQVKRNIYRFNVELIQRMADECYTAAEMIRAATNS